MSTILIVEDEKSIVDLISFNLRREGYEIMEAYDGGKGLELALSGKADLVLLDVMLPVMDGFEVLRNIRQTSSIPVIMVTAREEETDKIFGLETGADDYITKPFSVKELAARIKANIRRIAAQKPQSGGDTYGPFRLDRSLQSITKDGRALELTQREYDIICYFLARPSQVVSREELMEKVWGYDYYGDLRAVDVAMRRLREKLEDNPAEPKHLMTKRGAGYYLQF
ncbi:MAG: response regulator transcription factor [Clostridia bacterium]|nr:response regulator transcription factor [Clostridia bacterium]MBQ3062699.1 response regulator transcription factor [Clostridia bacterium]MBQ9966336.1 response regulator transcription factor [Clostridia bacterium]